MRTKRRRRIGLFIGREWSWPAAFLSEVNGRDNNVSADFVQIGESKWDSEIAYDVIIDRMSHEIPYYSTYLKYAVLKGCYVINNPFIGSAYDNFYGLSLAKKLGINTLFAIVLPNKRVETENVPESFRNLTYPLDWSQILKDVGAPAVLEDIKTGGKLFRQYVQNVNELIDAYDQSDLFTVVLSKSIEIGEFIRCIIIGQEDFLLLRVDSKGNIYESLHLGAGKPIYQTIVEWSRTITKALGYDINQVEFAIIDKQPILTNAGNSIPDFDINTLSPINFRWCVEKVADFAIDKAIESRKLTGRLPGHFKND